MSDAMRPEAIPLAQMRSDMENDPKFQKLARTRDVTFYYAAVGVYTSMTLRAWATASRTPDPEQIDLFPPDVFAALVTAKLLEADGSMPDPVFEKYIRPVMATALYRYFSATGDLLYVGISGRPNRRDGQHLRLSPWRPEAAQRTVEWHPDRESAEIAELKAIRSENPLFNVAGRIIS